MSKRLASFHGPSTPTSSPVQQHRHSTNVPSSPSRSTESTIHRKVRSLLQELRTCTTTWNDLVCHDGLRAATSLTDARTELDNSLRLVAKDEQPRSRIVGPKLTIAENALQDLDSVLLKLKKQFVKMNNIIDGLEALVQEAHKSKGWTWVQEEPLWCTWPLEKFANTIPLLLTPYHRALHTHTELVDTLRSHSITFEDSREILSKWVGQAPLQEEPWVSEWEEICEVEIERWNTR